MHDEDEHEDLEQRYREQTRLLGGRRNGTSAIASLFASVFGWMRPRAR